MSTTGSKSNSKRIVSARTIIWPAVVSIIVILAVMIMAIYYTTLLNEKLTRTLQDSAEYVEEVSDFMSGASLLKETSASFVVNPVDGEGNVIWGQIMPFAVELGTKHRRAEDLRASFSGHHVSEETIRHITEACECADYFVKTQLHAIALVTSVYPLPSMPPLEPVAHLEITEEEARLPEEARLGLAKSMLLNEEYAVRRQHLADAVNGAIGSIKESAAADVQETNRKVGGIRILLWASVILAVAILAVAFLTILSMLVSPLVKATKQIAQNKRMDETYGLKELRVAASSYNDLLSKRDHLERMLKAAAETDILTKLPNRYAFEQYIKTVKEDAGKYPLCYYIFDLNYLKYANDKYGHKSGDALLIKAAEVISKCFGDKCFRIGGDEFAAVIPNYSEEKAREMENKFRSLLEEEEISISFGSAVTDDLNVKTINQVMTEADTKMYDRKRIVHANRENRLVTAE